MKSIRLFIAVILLFAGNYVLAQSVKRNGGTLPDDKICSGSLSGQAYYADTGSMTGISGYSWMVTGGTISGSTTGSNVTVNWGASGGMLTCAIFMNGQGFPSYNPSLTTSVVGAPSVSITGPSVVCSANLGGNFSFTSTMTNGIGYLSYQWYRTNASNVTTAISGATSATLSTTLANGDKIQLKVSSTGWCGGSPISSNTYTTSVTSSVTPTVSVTSNKTDACTGQSVTFTASSTFAGGSPTYAWTMSGVTGTVSTTSTYSPSVNYSTTVPNAYSPGDQVTVTMTGLTNGTCLTSNNANGTAPTISIRPVPASPTGFASQAKCGPQSSVVLTATNGSDANTLRWYNGATLLGTTSTTTTGSFTTGSVSATTTFTVRGYYAASGCEGSGTNATVTINPIPGAPTPTAGFNSRCGNGIVSMKATPGSNGTEIKWYASISGGTFPGVATPGGTTASSPNISSSATYGMTSFNSTTGCETLTKTAIQATINAIPGLPTNLTATSRYGNGTVTLAGTSASTTITWYNASTGGTLIGTGTSNVTSPTITKSTSFYGASKNTSTFCESARVEVLALVKNLNSIITQSVTVAGKLYQNDVDVLPIGPVLQNTVYMDGLGRPVESVDKKITPDNLDLNTPMAYDNVGRENKKYLPFAADNTGDFKPVEDIIDANGDYTGVAATFYSTANDDIPDDSKPYAETVFEASPLNRPLKQGAPGAAWQPGTSPDRSIKTQYKVNAASEVRQFIYDVTTGLVSISGTTPYYPAGQLQVKVTTDEHQNDIVEYVDQLGHTICKKVQYKIETSVKKYLSTYYLYDDFDNLVVVLPPEAVAKFENP